jgi:hypothetical protein
MKSMSTQYIYRMVTAAMLLFVVLACEEEGERLSLGDPSSFVAPVLLNPPSAPAKVLLPENEAQEYETFSWRNARYGISVSVRYELQISRGPAFHPDSTRNLSVVEGTMLDSTRSVRISVKQMNDAMLALGLPGFVQSTVFLRVKSQINGIENDPLYSGSISRIATTYRTSECGNFCSVGIIGSATPGGWSTDTDMRLQDATGADKSTWTVTLYLTGGQEVKFRAMDSWETNWGASTFPTGTGVQNGPNIPIPVSGYYRVVFNDETGAYSFTSITSSFSQIGLIGTGVGGWGDSDEKFLTQSGTDPHVWTGTFTFSVGEVKFRANASWFTNWGATTYPSGYGIGNGPNIPVPVAGTYFVYFNSASGEYLFGPVANNTPYADIGLIGTATPNGWAGPDLDLIRNPANNYHWSKVVALTEGEAKFRADNDWSVNWGASSFPGGVGVQNGANIPVQGGTYFVRFNSLTGEYYFLK